MTALNSGAQAAAPAAVVSPMTQSCDGNVQVTNTADNSVLGYISKNLSFGVLFAITSTPSDYLEVTYTTGSQVNVTTVNGPGAPTNLLGGIVGNLGQDFATGSPNYAWLGGTASTAPGSPPASRSTTVGFRNSESAIWTATTSTLTPTWINTDGSAAPTQLYYDVSANYLGVAGDLSAFDANYGETTDPVSFTCIPLQQSQTISFAQPSSPQPYGGSMTLSASATSGLPVTFTVDASSGAGVCQTSGTDGATLTFTGIGTCVVDANQAGSSAWAAASQVQQSITVVKAATTTSLSVSPSNPALNQPVTLTATVGHTGSGAAPSGTVSFYDGTYLLGTATLTGGTTATITTTFSGGSHSLTATYNGDGNYTASTSTPATPVTVGCDRTITTPQSGLSVSSGTTCVIGTTINGGISVARGATLDIENSTVQGSISAGSPAGIRICGSTTGAISVSGATGYVRIGDPANNCAANTINGGLTAAGNHGGGTISGNTIAGSWTITNNTPTFTATGNHH